MSENRQALNKTIQTLANLDVKFGNITQALEKEVFQVEQFVQLYLQLDSIIQAIRRTVWQANSYVEHEKLQLNMLSLGHLSPSVITPSSMKSLLLEIENHLPQYLKLWYDPKGELEVISDSYLYHSLDKGRFFVIASIPLLDNINTFEIFNIFNISVPGNDLLCQQMNSLI